MTLTGKAAIVTGGRRIGAVVASTLGARGMDVAVSYHRSRGTAERVVTEIESCGRRGVAIAADSRGPRRVRRWSRRLRPPSEDSTS